jgi:hypothetical protein
MPFKAYCPAARRFASEQRAMSIGRYFTEMFDLSMNWNDMVGNGQGLERSILPEGHHTLIVCSP